MNKKQMYNGVKANSFKGLKKLLGVDNERKRAKNNTSVELLKVSEV